VLGTIFIGHRTPTDGGAMGAPARYWGTPNDGKLGYDPQETGIAANLSAFVVSFGSGAVFVTFYGSTVTFGSSIC